MSVQKHVRFSMDQVTAKRTNSATNGWAAHAVSTFGGNKVFFFFLFFKFQLMRFLFHTDFATVVLCYFILFRVRLYTLHVIFDGFEHRRDTRFSAHFQLSELQLCV
jgi:hypothetical protein